MEQNNFIKDVEKLLGEQTKTILSAVDERLEKVDERLEKFDERFEKVEVRLSVIEQTLQEHNRMLRELSDRISELTNTLDAFLKRLTDHEQEFEIMKADLKRVKTVIKEKLGVNLD